MRRIVLRLFLVLVVLAVVAAGGSYAYLTRSLPDFNADETVRGLRGDVDIVRDEDAIPHIFASNRLDGLFGLGYVHAQDRLWQMEFQRRIGHGRLSEVFGSATLAQDRFLRTVGFGRAARSAWASLPAEAREKVDAYVAGVNAFIGSHHGAQLPPEFTLLRFEPEPFTPEDVMVWVKMMAWDLSANYASELVRHDLIAKVGQERTGQLLPPTPPDALTILNDQQPGAPQTHTAPVAAAGQTSRAWSDFERMLTGGHPEVAELLLAGAHHEAIGSNNWVVDGTLTATGAPMLANDPHLTARIPSIWYLAHVSAGDVDMIGATLPGTPAVALGRNQYIAWGATNVAADVQDLYRERLDPSGTFAEFQGVQEPITVIPETIIVKGRPPVVVNVRVTRHGPLVSDAINANTAASKTGAQTPPLEPLAFRWTALDPDDRTVDAFMRLNEARNWDDFTSALRDYVTPSQNFVYADIEGHIGYYAPGHVPVRAAGDGSQPTDGWTGDTEWAGFVPFESLPHAYDPPSHMIVTANNRPSGAMDAPLVSTEFPNPYRARRITELLAELSASHKLTPDDFARVQADTVSLHARDLLPRLLAHAQPTAALDREAIAILRAWDDDAKGQSAAPAIFEAWFLKLAPAIVGDELGTLSRSYEGRFSSVTRFIEDTLDGNPAWCDDVTTDSVKEGCDETVTAALHTAVEDLAARMGREPQRWRWDAVHAAAFAHQGFDTVGFLRPIVSRRVPNGGDWSTVNVGPVAVEAPYEQRSVPGYREIIDLSRANDSRFLEAVGPSGHVLSKYYAAFQQDWKSVRYRTMRMDRLKVESTALGRLRLRAQAP